MASKKLNLEQRKVFSERLNELLFEKNMSSYRLAQISGISEATIGRWVHGSTSPSVSNVSVVANALNTTVNYLLGETDKKNKPTTISELTPEEIEHLKLFRIASEDARRLAEIALKSDKQD